MSTYVLAATSAGRSLVPGKRIRAVLNYLARVASDDGWLKHPISDPRLAAAAGVSERTVQRARKLAVELGLLHAVSGIGHRRTTYRWILATPKQQERRQTERAHDSVRPHGGPWGAVVDEIRQLRPDWDRAGIAWTLAKARKLPGRPGLDRVRAALVAVAKDAGSRSPARVLHTGWWWDPDDPRHGPPRPAKAPDSALTAPVAPASGTTHTDAPLPPKNAAPAGLLAGLRRQIADIQRLDRRRATERTHR